MTRDELSLLLLTLTPAEIFALYKAPARADLILANLSQRYSDLDAEKWLYHVYATTETPAAAHARLILCVEKVKKATPQRALLGHALLPDVTRGIVGTFFQPLVAFLRHGTYHGVATTLDAFDKRLQGAFDVTNMSVAALVATADCLAELRRLDNPLREDRVERYRQDLVEIFEAWCAL
jgi:hypothetical protein